MLTATDMVPVAVKNGSLCAESVGLVPSMVVLLGPSCNRECKDMRPSGARPNGDANCFLDLAVSSLDYAEAATSRSHRDPRRHQCRRTRRTRQSPE